MKRRHFWPALLALVAAPKALMAVSLRSLPDVSPDLRSGPLTTAEKAWFCVLCRQEVAPAGRVLYVMHEDGSMRRDPDECPNCGAGLFVQARPSRVQVP